MKACILSEDGKQYDPAKQFVSYVVQRQDNSRFLIFQYQNTGDQNYSLITLNQKPFMPTLSEPGTPGKNGMFAPKETPEYNLRVNIISLSEAMQNLTAEGNKYHMEIHPKEYMGRIINLFEFTDGIRANSAAEALKFFTDRVEKAFGININPVDLTLNAFERIAEKKADAGCVIL